MHTSNIHTHTHTNTRTQVFVPFELKSGLPPRRVALERKRRRYQAYDIEHLLLERKLDYIKMELDGKPFESDLDLMVFDNRDFETFHDLDSRRHEVVLERWLPRSVFALSSSRLRIITIMV